MFTDRVRSTREGYVLTRICPSVCLSTGGYPGQVQMGGTPARSDGGVPQPGPTGTWGGVPPAGMGYPKPGLTGGILARSDRGVPEVGYPLAGMGYPKPGLRVDTQGGVPPSKDGVPPPLGPTVPPRITPPPRDRTVDGVLDTPRSVCLLRSRRRTLLFQTIWISSRNNP